ncbi:ATP-dependent helicase C-terminal domain-containing protein [Wenjunlia tyrosinilytica]|uniref:ATP-dependent helicase C-terminal domain-containing protein n=1 Tax=Wenjunlia tyrosinilytica TaxID=1544741 RepID=UPI001E3F694E|nr:ATP-dependent helicase C-terminal domain-containing protein [Wenjunlia tyrosinilytica]
MILRDAWRELPVREVVPELQKALAGQGTAVLAAPPGTGKTTLVPLALAGLVPELPGAARRVLVAEPRRMAVRAAARRMAWLLGEQVGGRVGFTVRGERRAGPRTVVEVVTTGVLLQRLQRDPELAGVDAVLLDECHERHLDADTALAFLLDVREALRPELQVVAASATAETGPWARLLGRAPVVEAQGVPHPVETVWAPPPGSVRPSHGTWVDPELLRHIAAVVRRALGDRDGDVLCFLPGAGEIARVAGLLEGGLDAEVLQVHGRAPAAVQDAVLGEGGGRRVVLATSVAESSLTVPGVRTVVDCGLAREPRTDHARGLGSLTTVRVSRASADQRAGRAGRLGPGTVYRCWSQGEHDRLPPRPSPQIAVADLAEFALQTACWGDPDASGLALLDAPPLGAMRAAQEVLRGVGAVDEDGRVTERGRRLARVGVHPRLARALVDGAEAVGARRAAEVVALLSEQAPPGSGDDLTALWRAQRNSERWKEEVRRLRRSVEHVPAEGSSRSATGDDEQRRQDTAKGGDPSRGTSEGYPPTAGSSRSATGDDERRRQDTAKGGDPSRGTSEGYPPTAGSSRSATGDDERRRQDTAKGGDPSRGTSEGYPPTAGSSRSATGDDERRRQDTAKGGDPSRGTSEGYPPTAGSSRSATGDEEAAGLVVAMAFPERVARARRSGGHLMVSGTAAALSEGSRLAGSPWLAVAVADRPPNAPSARVRLAVPVSEEVARRAAAPFRSEGEEVAWSRGDVVARRVERLGAVELASRPLVSPDPALVRRALLDGLRAEGVELLGWSREAVELRQRIAFCHRTLGEPWPDVSDEALLERAEAWLGPELDRARRRADLARVSVREALSRLLPWADGTARRFEEYAPERVTVPSGSRIRVDYSADQPVLAVKLQELFGWHKAPALAGGRVPLVVHLLSPAGRPAAVTADLASFWREGYRAVRAELRGRYPKHPWPEDPATAEPTRHTNTRLRR